MVQCVVRPKNALPPGRVENNFVADGFHQWRCEGVCHPGQTSLLSHPAIRPPFDILIVTTMALAWTVNQTRNLPGDLWSHCQC